MALPPHFPAVLIALLASPLAAQQPEHFSVQYQGGDSRLPSKLYGYLVLTDSALEFHRCATYNCEGQKGGRVYEPASVIAMPWRKLTYVASGLENRGATLGGKLLVGALAPGQRDETVVLSYDTEATAEAPVFKTKAHESAQVLAKIRFHLRKLGLLKTGVTVRDSMP